MGEIFQDHDSAKNLNLLTEFCNAKISHMGEIFQDHDSAKNWSLFL